MAPFAEDRKDFIRLDTAASIIIGFFVLVAMALSVRLAFRKAQAEEVQRAYWIATEGGNEGFYMWKALRGRTGEILDLKVIDCNERGAELYGMKKAQLMGKRYSQLYPSIDFEQASAILRHACEDGYLEDDFEVPASSPLRARWVHRKMARTREGWAVTLRDISQIKANEQAMMRMATEDSLTGLPNRHWLMLNLPGMLARARQNGSMLAILFIDLDDFKDVNDSLGHSAGDALLKSTAQRLRLLIRPGDSIVRLGGDEFTVVLDQVTGSDVETVATGIVEAFKAPFELSEGKHFVGTSIGIGVYPRDGGDMETLLKNADIAMYSAKTTKGNFCFFTAQLYERLQARLTTEKDLMRALQDDELVVHYQPRVNTLTGAIVGLEALVRWNHPTRGEVQPGEFVPVAEKTDIILRLGAAVVNKVCAQLAQWQSAGVPVVPVSINVSAKQFNGCDVKGMINDCLHRYGIRAELLEIELTESTMIGEGKEIMAQMEEIRALGIRIHLDDFGTGYSSLALLQRLHVDVLKVDRASTSKLAVSSEGEIFFRAIVSIAHALGMDIVAEGVETIEQLRVLQELGCDEVQGFFISRPVPGEEITPLMAKSRLFPMAVGVAQDCLTLRAKEALAAGVAADECNDKIRQMENELLHQKMRFDFVCQASGEGLWNIEIDPEETIQGNTKFWWSDQFRNLLGYQDERDFPNVLSSWSDLLHPDDRQCILEAFDAHLADRTGRTHYAVEYRLKCKDGVYRWFRAVGETQRDIEGNLLRVAGGLALIEEQKQREVELDITITRFEMSREMLTDGIWDLAVMNGDPLNPDNEFWWSPQFRRLLGFETEAEFPNVLSSWSSRIHPDDVDVVMSTFIAHLCDKSGKTPYDIEYRLRDKNNLYHYFRARGQTKRAPDGSPLRAIGALTNLDDLKNLLAAERAKAEYQLTLVSSLKDILEEERVALSREVHDQLGQALSAAKIDIKLLEDDIRPVDAPLSRRKISKELRSARHSIEKAIQSIREIAANLRSPELEGQGLFAAINWHARDFERRTRIKCVTEISDALGEPRGLIAVVLLRIFREATTNILRHAKASEVWVSLDRRGAMILLRVRDNGVGIEPAVARSKHSMGIKGMRERVTIVRGRLIVSPLRPRGTLVSARIPITADHHDEQRLLPVLGQAAYTGDKT